MSYRTQYFSRPHSHTTLFNVIIVKVALFFLAFVMLWHPSLDAVARGVFKPTLSNLRVMTISATKEAARLTECQLAHKAFYGRLPRRSVIDINGNSYCFKRGIDRIVKKADYIYLMSRGYARRRSITGPGKDDHFTYRGGGIIHTRDRIAQNVVHLKNNAVAITFDYKDRYVNCGQRRDIACLARVYDGIKKANPTAHIIIVGECLGAKTALELAIKRQIDNCTLIMESPFFAASDLFKNMAQNYMNWPGLESIIHSFFKWFHHYDPQQDDLPDRLDKLPKKLRIFACHRNRDDLISDEHVQKNMAKIERVLGKERVSFYRFDDAQERHSSSFRWPGAQQAVNCFYERHGLPYKIVTHTAT